MSTYSQDLALALQLADAADSISMSRYQSQDLVVTTKPDNTPVTDADKATEKAIRELIARNHPDDGIIGEEFGEESAGEKRHWIIDPIDGTKNFMRGVPTWATLIALVDDGEVVVGVASAPALTRRWFASKGDGAFVSFNSGAPRKIGVSKVSNLEDASLMYSDLIGFNERLPAFRSIMDACWRSRGMGDFWSHMLVAEGAADIAIEPSLALWDMAALDIIVREAGGSFTSITGEPGPTHKSGISSNGTLHQKVIAKLNGN